VFIVLLDYIRACGAQRITFVITYIAVVFPGIRECHVVISDVCRWMRSEKCEESHMHFQSLTYYLMGRKAFIFFFV